MEMYYFDIRSLTKLCHFFLHRNGELAAALLSILTPVLNDLFCIRAANELLGLGLSWLDVSKQCTYKKGRLEFNYEEFISKYLNKGSQLTSKARFTAAVESLRAKKPIDPRYHINGHDFILLLGKCLHGLSKNKNLSDPDVVMRALGAALDYKALLGLPLFKVLIQRVTS